jgi:hypothetical protein
VHIKTNGAQPVLHEIYQPTKPNMLKPLFQLISATIGLIIFSRSLYTLAKTFLQYHNPLQKQFWGYFTDNFAFTNSAMLIWALVAFGIVCLARFYNKKQRGVNQ